MAIPAYLWLKDDGGADIKGTVDVRDREGSKNLIWFALYRVDGNIDDHTFIDAVDRGNFRLHPAGYEGISNGCITLPSPSHFLILRDALLRTPKFQVSGSLYAYGTVQVY